MTMTFALPAATRGWSYRTGSCVAALLLGLILLIAGACSTAELRKDADFLAATSDTTKVCMMERNGSCYPLPGAFCSLNRINHMDMHYVEGSCE